MNYVLIDIEWFDFENKNLPLQLAAIKCDENKQIKSKFNVKIKPPENILVPEKTIEFMNMTNESCYLGESCNVALSDFLNWCGDDFTLVVFACHSLFVLKNNLKQVINKMPWQSVIDLQNMQIDNIECNNTLSFEKTCILLGITLIKPSHISANDVENLYQLFLKFERFIPIEIHKPQKTIEIKILSPQVNKLSKKIRKAKQANLNILSSSQYNFFVTSNGNKFHSSKCKYLTKTNYIITGYSKLKSVLKLNYEPCKYCIKKSTIELLNSLIENKAKNKLTKQNEVDETKINKMCSLCEEYNFEYNIAGNVIFIYTKISSWYFNIYSTTIKLYHKNFRTQPYHGKFSGEYHVQYKHFSSPIAIIKYIKQHDDHKYKTF